MPVGELSARVGLSQPLISWHLRILRVAGLIDTQKPGARDPLPPPPRRLRGAPRGRGTPHRRDVRHGHGAGQAAPEVPMSASHPRAPDLPRGDSLAPSLAEAGRTRRPPPDRALARSRSGITANTVTVVGLAHHRRWRPSSSAAGMLLLGAAVLLGGSRPRRGGRGASRARHGGGTPFGELPRLDPRPRRRGDPLPRAGRDSCCGSQRNRSCRCSASSSPSPARSSSATPARRRRAIGVDASIGLAPRTERLVLIIAGIALAGLGIGAVACSAPSGSSPP